MTRFFSSSEISSRQDVAKAYCFFSFFLFPPFNSASLADTKGYRVLLSQVCLSVFLLMIVFFFFSNRFLEAFIVPMCARLFGPFWVIFFPPHTEELLKFCFPKPLPICRWSQNCQYSLSFFVTTYLSQALSVLYLLLTFVMGFWSYSSLHLPSCVLYFFFFFAFLW